MSGKSIKTEAATSNDLVLDFGIPPKGDALGMQPLDKHVDPYKQAPLTFKAAPATTAKAATEASAGGEGKEKTPNEEPGAGAGGDQLAVEGSTPSAQPSLAVQPPETAAEAEGNELPKPPTMNDKGPYKCSFAGCNVKSATCATLFAHIKKAHTFGKQPTAWKDSAFIKQVRVERNAYERKRRLAVNEDSSDSEQPKQKKGKNREETNDAENAGTQPTAPALSGDTSQIVQRMCYVLADSQGKPIIPLVVRGLVDAGQPLMTYAPPQGLPPSSGAQLQVFGTELQFQDAASLPSSSHQIEVRAPQNPMAMLSFVHDVMQEKRREEISLKNWKDAIPKVQVKKAYIDATWDKFHSSADAKAYWPADFQKDAIDLVEFRKWLEELRKGPANSQKMLLGASRIMGSIEIVAGTGEPVTPMSDVKTLMGLYLSGTLDALFRIHTFSPEYGWTLPALEGLANYANCWVSLLNDQKILNDAGPLEQYKSVLAKIIEKVSGGHKKKCKEQRELGYAAKAEKDEWAVLHFPSYTEVVNPGVAKAFILMQLLHDKYKGQASMPAKARALANTLASGVWHYATFMGRRWEVEHALREKLASALQAAQHYLRCRFHKTYKTYGDVVKVLTDGLEQFLTCYNELPRDDDAGELFFVSAYSKKGNACHFGNYLITFNKVILELNVKDDKVSFPTTNTIRKYFHQALKENNKEEQARIAFMELMDKHGAKTQGKHYLYRTVQDDLALGRALIEKVVKIPVPWPSRTDVDNAHDLSNKLESLLDKCAEDVEGSDHGDEVEDEGSEVELEYWEGAERFGVMNPLELQLVPLGDAPGNVPLAIEDDRKEDDSKKEGRNDKKKKKDHKKEKKSKKDKRKEEKTKKEKGSKKEAVYEDPSAFQQLEVEAERQRQAKYEYIPSPGGKRAGPLGPEEKVEIEQMLNAWQQQNGHGPCVKPSVFWNWTLRCDLIDSGSLQNYHSWDITRNVVKSIIAQRIDQNSKDID